MVEAHSARLDRDLQALLDADDIDPVSIGRTCRLVAEFVDDAKRGGAAPDDAIKAIEAICGRIGREFG